MEMRDNSEVWDMKRGTLSMIFVPPCVIGDYL